MDLKVQGDHREAVVLVYLIENEEIRWCQLSFGVVTRQRTSLTFVSNFISRLLQLN